LMAGSVAAASDNPETTTGAAIFEPVEIEPVEGSDGGGAS
jgi:hypothetical protein